MCVQTCTISGREIALATKFSAVAPTILRWLLDFGIFTHPCIYAIIFAYDLHRLSFERSRSALGPF